MRRLRISSSEHALQLEMRFAMRVEQLGSRAASVRACTLQEFVRPLRSLESFARDNATEGCVRETFGALIGHYQAATARDPEIAVLMRGIAEDETRHAALSHRIARWVEPKLTAAGRHRIAAARIAAVATLFRGLEQSQPAATLCERAGVPDAVTATLLLRNLVMPS
jgi:hypothetical protein